MSIKKAISQTEYLMHSFLVQKMQNHKTTKIAILQEWVVSQSDTIKKYQKYQKQLFQKLQK